MYRPPGYEELKKKICGQCAFADNAPSEDCDFCERHADAMLEALMKLNHHNSKLDKKIDGGPGTWVFIPDEPEQKEKKK